jgi:transcriptional regulator
MYLPPAFREDDPRAQLDLINTRPLGLLVSKGGAGLVANSIPFIVYPSEGERGVLRAHVARANAQWRELAASPDCLVVFQGPDAYITPTWYPTKAETHKVVPTWNYVAVHVWGRAQICESAEWLRRQIGDLTNRMESGFPRPWSLTEAPGDFIDAQLKAIVGIEITITRSEGKWKVSQNRTEADRRGVVSGLQASARESDRQIADEVARRGPVR